MLFSHNPLLHCSCSVYTQASLKLWRHDYTNNLGGTLLYIVSLGPALSARTFTWTLPWILCQQQPLNMMSSWGGFFQVWHKFPCRVKTHPNKSASLGLFLFPPFFSSLREGTPCHWIFKEPPFSSAAQACVLSGSASLKGLRTKTLSLRLKKKHAYDITHNV